MFEKNVFINCPFDDDYRLLFSSILFTIVSLGYNPRVSLESSNALQVRLNKIIDLIKESKYSIHDLSRLKSSSIEEYSRMNMPFELGLDFGCKNYSKEHDSKKCMIIAETKYEYMLAISDISGIDIKSHDGDVRKLMQHIRNWFHDNCDDNSEKFATHVEIYNDFWEWNTKLFEDLTTKGLTKKEIDETPIKEQIQSMKSFYARKSS